MNKIIKCQGYVRRVFYPKGNLEDFEPGSWASFLADITDVIEGEFEEGELNRWIKIAGEAPSLEDHTEYNFTIKEVIDEKYGKNYEILYMSEVVDFDNIFDQRKFLEKIISNSKVNLLYEKLVNPFSVIKQGDIEKLCSVKGIGESSAKQIIGAYQDNIEFGNAYVELDKFDISKTMMKKLLEEYKSADTLIKKIKKNPYMLIDDVDGIGWKKADSMAMSAGLNTQSLFRVEAYIKYFMSRQAEEGNSIVKIEALRKSVIEDIGIKDASVYRKALYNLRDEGVLWWNEEKTVFALTRVRNLEQNIANELYRIKTAKPFDVDVDIEERITQIEREQGITYTDEQKQAIIRVCSNNVSILTGYGGTGKTTVVAAVLKILSEHSFAQTALSGRAAARMSEITSHEGYTIHRLLGYDFIKREFTHNKKNPLRQEIIVLDETSMVGAELFYSLIQSIASGSRLIMIGDDGQLESIGLCNIFKDMLNSQVIPVARLTKIHRQAAKSAIITESIKVRQNTQITKFGWTGTEVRGELKDLKLDIYGDMILSQSHIIDNFKFMYSKLHSADKIQIVVPQKFRGEIATYHLNNIVQGIVNDGDKDCIEVYVPGKELSYLLKVGDRVIVNKNNYKDALLDPSNKNFRTENKYGEEVAEDSGYNVCPVFNGNIGKIISIDPEYEIRKNGKKSKKVKIRKRYMVIDFEQWGLVKIPKSMWSTVELAYALTCHKLQGSEADFVIVGLDFSAREMLTREWLYTAITRAKKKCVICAETNSLQFCVMKSNIPLKTTFLIDFLHKKVMEKT